MRLATKRCLDVAVSAVGLVVLSPLLGAVAVAIQLANGRPILFRQARPGRGAKTFQLVKFRTMAPGPGDDAVRLTRLGRWLRRTSLDELPEMWNVLRGDMSLVGPRPLLVGYVGLYSAEQARRHEMRPGVTGLAQVNGRNATDWSTRLAWDVTYVDTWSLRLDLWILVRSLGLVFSGRGTSADGHATMPPFLGGP